MRRAAFFDMDRTLVRVNTARLWAAWQRRHGKARRREMLVILWWLARYSVGAIDVPAVARGVIARMRGRREEEFAAEVEQWVRAEVLREISDAARDAVRAHQRAGDLLALLSTTTVYAGRVVAAEVGIEHVLASRFTVVDGVFTGEVDGPLIYGQGKVSAAEAWAHTHDVDLSQSVFYTDSISDLPMLERVGFPHVVNPDPRLRWAARRRRWPVSRWE